MFALFRIVPGDPAAMLIDPKMTAEAKQNLRASYGLDKPILAQYGIYLKDVTRGDFGHSFWYGRPVFDVLLEKLPNTILLFTTATVLAWLVGFTLGKRIGWERGSRLEYILTIAGLFFYTIFVPWFGLMMIMLFSKHLNLFPIGGMLTPELWLNREHETTFRLGLDVLHHLILPVFTLTLLGFAGSMLLTKNSMLEVLAEDYVLTARAKGLPDRIIRDRHVARNALLPVVTAVTLSLSFSMSGGVLTEFTFSWPGLGAELVAASLNYDYPLAQAAFLSLAAVVLFGNLVADVLYAYLDPRIQY